MKFVGTLNPARVARWLGLIALYLALQSLVTEYLVENVLGSSSSGLIVSFMDLFSVNAEETIPTWFATMLLLASAVILAVITVVKRQSGDGYGRYWAGLSLIFLYLSIDEGAVIHELFSNPLEAAFNTSGYLAFAWLILFVPLVLIFALIYLRFLIHLPPRIRNLFILAGGCYVGGAVVVEAIGANRYSIDGGVTFAYLAVATVEELLEMWGVVVFIYALLAYMATEGISAVVSPTPAAGAGPVRVGRPGGSSRRLRLALVLVLLAINSALVAWAFQQQPAPVKAADTPFYQLVSQRFADQGVIILGINEAITVDNPAAPPIAAALLTLFDDVLVITLSDSQVSIAFAGPRLPFNSDTLGDLAEESGEEAFIILNGLTLRAIAAGDGRPE